MNFVFGESLFKSLTAPKAYLMIDCIVCVFLFFYLLEALTEIFIFYSQFLFFVLRHNINGKLCNLLPFLCVFCFLTNSKLRQINGTTAGSAATEYHTRNFAQSAKMG